MEAVRHAKTYGADRAAPGVPMVLVKPCDTHVLLELIQPRLAGTG
jgi:hypothetical protein